MGVREMDVLLGDYDANFPVIEVSIDGIPRAIQMDLEDNTGKFSIKMHGSEVGVFLMSRGEYELSRHMKAPPVLDTGDLLLSPMPGTLISYAVEEGDRVEAGQEICVVEAMKMQNLIRSVREGVIAKL